MIRICSLLSFHSNYMISIGYLYFIRNLHSNSISYPSTYGSFFLFLFYISPLFPSVSRSVSLFFTLLPFFIISLHFFWIFIWNETFQVWWSILPDRSNKNSSVFLLLCMYVIHHTSTVDFRQLFIFFRIIIIICCKQRTFHQLEEKKKRKTIFVYLK